MKKKVCQVEYVAVEYESLSKKRGIPDLESENYCGSYYCDSPMAAWEMVRGLFSAPLTRIHGTDDTMYTVSEDGTMVVIT